MDLQILVIKDEKPSLLKTLKTLKAKYDRLSLDTGIIRNFKLKNDFIKRQENIDKLAHEESKLKNEFRIKKNALKLRTIKIT